MPLTLFYLVWRMLFGQQGGLSVVHLKSINNESFLFTKYLLKVIYIEFEASFWIFLRKNINLNCFQMIFNYLCALLY